MISFAVQAPSGACFCTEFKQNVHFVPQFLQFVPKMCTAQDSCYNRARPNKTRS